MEAGKSSRIARKRSRRVACGGRNTASGLVANKGKMMKRPRHGIEKTKQGGIRVRCVRQAVVFLCLLIAVSMLVAGCGGILLYDRTQVPVIGVGEGLRPVISWTPVEAYELSVYEGTEDGNGFGVIWSARGTGGYANNLMSPVTYGLPPPGSDVREAPPLERGKTYTVTVFRKDPKGGGDGFTNTRHRYVGKKTFVAGGD